MFVWAVFIRNIAKDHTHSSGFKVVHITLAVISLAFAAGCFAVVSRSRRGAVTLRSRREDAVSSSSADLPAGADHATSATPSGRR